jgi:ADP-heptose:LPS heptosyltransferase
MNALMKSGQSEPKRIVIFRALYLGDLLNAVPAFRALKRAFPKSQITLVGLPWSVEFVQRFHSYLDEFIPFPGFPGLPEQAPDLPGILSFLKDMQARHIDLAIQMQGSGEVVNPMIELFGAKRTAGFYLPGQYCPDKNWYLEYPEHEPEVWRHLRLMEWLGIPLQGDELELPLFEEDWRSFRQVEAQFHLEGEYVCIHPGANARERRWPPHYFAVVADRLAAHGYRVVLTGTEKEAHLTASVALHMRAPAIDLAGKTSLGTLGALLSNARLVVSNDTGTSHVAAALKTPSVILFPVPESLRWAPKNAHLHKRIWDAMSKEPEEILPQVEEHLNHSSSRQGEPLLETRQNTNLDI